MITLLSILGVVFWIYVIDWAINDDDDDDDVSTETTEVSTDVVNDDTETTEDETTEDDATEDETTEDEVTIDPTGLSVLNGTPEHDTLVGTNGEDVIFGNGECDELQGKDGDDAILGGSNNDDILGGGGHDFLQGGQGLDTLVGNSGDDILDGTSALDETALRDSLTTATSVYDLALNYDYASEDTDGADTLHGNGGNDYLLMGSGDSGTGGSGDDIFSAGDWIRPGEPAVVEDYDEAEDVITYTYAGSAIPTITTNVDSATGDATVYADGEAVIVVVNAGPSFDSTHVVLLEAV